MAMAELILLSIKIMLMSGTSAPSTPCIIMVIELFYVIKIIEIQLLPLFGVRSKETSLILH